jgi:hypothetical protein
MASEKIKVNYEYKGKYYLILVEHRRLSIKPNYQDLSFNELKEHQEVLIDFKENFKKLLFEDN